MIGTIVFCTLTQKGPCGMTVNNDIDDGSATKHSDSHNLGSAQEAPQCLPARSFIVLHSLWVCKPAQVVVWSKCHSPMRLPVFFFVTFFV